MTKTLNYVTIILCFEKKGMIFISTKKKPKLNKKLNLMIIPIIILGLIFVSTIAVVSMIYKPMYKVQLDGKMIGYVKERAEFDKVYEKLKTEKLSSNQEVNIYLSNNPTFEKCFVKSSILNEQNLYTNLRPLIKTEYTVYALYVKNEKQMVFTKNEDAEKYLNNLKNGVKDLSVEIKKEITNEPVETTTFERAEVLTNDLISRNKPAPVVRKSTTLRKNVGNPVASAAGGVWPTKYKMITTYFADRSGRHAGIDFANDIGTPIYAYKSGKVIASGWDGAYGNTIDIDHGNGVVTRYAHNSKNYVKVGDTVEQGAVIAAMGSTGRSTGSHLHFELRINDIPQNPMIYLK